MKKFYNLGARSFLAGSKCLKFKSIHRIFRIQKRLDLYEADEGSSFSSEDVDQTDTGKISHSTPLIRHSIYNELKDRVSDLQFCLI